MWRQFPKVSSIASVPMFVLLLVLFPAGVWADDTQAKRTTPVPGGQRTEIVMNVPLDAVIFIDGRRTENGGGTRRFVTPPLAPGHRYFYDVKVTWVEGSQARENSRHVSFRAGERVVLNYTEASQREERREAGWDLYLDPNAPNPSSNDYYRDPLVYPYYVNPSFVFPGYRFYPR